MAKNFDFPWDPPKPPAGPVPKDKNGRPMVWARSGDRRNNMSGWQWSEMNGSQAFNYDKGIQESLREIARGRARSSMTPPPARTVVPPKVTPVQPPQTYGKGGMMPTPSPTPNMNKPSTPNLPVKKGKPKTYRSYS